MLERKDRGSTIVIDGAEGEGGGQIVRTGVALSTLTGKDVVITNIRAGRPRPGLANQHLSSIRAVAEICEADLTGDEVGSTRIGFSPGRIRCGSIKVDVGTAGSVSLVLQSSLLALAKSEGMNDLEIRGGTDVRQAPSISYFELVLFPLLEMMGFKAKLEEYDRGFYPEGGGRCHVRWNGTRDPKGLSLLSRGRFNGIHGVAYAQNLPDHVPGRISMECKRLLVAHQPVNLRVECSKGNSTGAGIVLCAEYGRTRFGSSCLGERGLSSEKVAHLASSEIDRMIDSTSTLDPHAADQLLPYMAISNGPSSFIIDEISSHLRSQVHLVKLFLDVEIVIEGSGPFIVNVRPNRT